jgi:hypothetical protein
MSTNTKTTTNYKCVATNPWNCLCHGCNERIHESSQEERLQFFVSTDDPLKTIEDVVKIVQMYLAIDGNSYGIDTCRVKSIYKFFTTNKWFLFVQPAFARTFYDKLLEFSNCKTHAVLVMTAFYLQYFTDVWEHHGFVKLGSIVEDDKRRSVRLENKNKRRRLL